MDKEFFEKLKEKIQPYFIKGGSHSFDHTERVWKLSTQLAKEENADLEIVQTAALLHDIARLKEDKGEVECHAKGGAKLAREILKRLNFPEEKVDKICYAIDVHRHSTNINPETKEAKILQDADRLDALGAITIARMFSSGGEFQIPMHDPKQPIEEVHDGIRGSTTINGFYKKILKLKPEQFNTSKAKEIAKHRYKFVQDFLKEFLDEWEGKK